MLLGYSLAFHQQARLAPANAAINEISGLMKALMESIVRKLEGDRREESGARPRQIVFHRVRSFTEYQKCQKSVSRKTSIGLFRRLNGKDVEA